MKIQLKILNKEFYQKINQFDCGSWSENLPKYATQGSAAIDLVCTEDITIYPGETKMIHTGIAIWIGSGLKTCMLQPSGYEPLSVAGFILPRSGLGGDKGLILANTIGLIDEDYQGELLVKAWNRKDRYIPHERYSTRIGSYVNEQFVDYTPNKVELKAGDRFCQLVFMPVIKCSWDIVEDFSSITSRGKNGFGSSGN